MLVLEAAARQLKELESQLLASNPKLENHLALYLQVLRDGLLAAVQQACFHLATQVYPDRYGGLEPSSRQLLHRRLVQLVQRTNSLLSLERVVGHAAQIARQQQRERRSQRRRVLDSIAEFGAEQEEGPEQGPEEGRDKGPEGSVHLGMALPISSDFLIPRGERPQPAGPAESDGEGEGEGGNSGASRNQGAPKRKSKPSNTPNHPVLRRDTALARSGATTTPCSPGSHRSNNYVPRNTHPKPFPTRRHHQRPHNPLGHISRKMFRGTFSGTRRAVTPPKNPNPATCAATHDV